MFQLRWPTAPDAIRYRVVVRNVKTGELLKLESERPEAEADPAAGAEETFEWRVQAAGVDGRWADHLPYMEWPRKDEPGAPVLRWEPDGAELHRVVVHDDTADAIVVKAATLASSYPLERSRLDPGHDYRWRVQRWEDGSWHNDGPYVPLPEERAEIRVTGLDVPAPDEAEEGSVLFLFTSDTEVHLRWMADPDGPRGIEEQIFGRLGGEEVGIGRQMQMLDEYGYKGTFFVDVLAEHQFGDGSLQPVFDEILARGHDAQLHLHPSPHLRFAHDERIRALSPATSRDDPAMFRAAMELAIELFERRAGRSPIAYRAGAYRIFDSHFAVLRDLGIAVDSSVNPFKNFDVAPWLRTRTQPAWVDGVFEVPVTWYLRRDGARCRPEQLAPVRSPTAQLAAVSQWIGTAGGPPVTLCYIAHSYSFLGTTRISDRASWVDWNERWERRVGAQERAISGYNVGAPLVQLDHVDERRIETFAALVAELSQRRDVEGISLAELAQRRQQWPVQTAAVDPLAGYDERARRPTATATRRYSAAFLAELEAGVPS